MKKKSLPLIVSIIGLSLLVGCTSMPMGRSSHIYRVPCRVTSGSHDLQIFIATGSKAPPMITIADNDGYPPIRDFYARPARMAGKDGINVTIRFQAPAKGREISLNVLQEGMTRHFAVMPFKRSLNDDPDTRYITLSGFIDGSEQFHFTKDKIRWSHLHWSAPSDLKFCGESWERLQETPAAWSETQTLDLSKAHVVKREGRDVIALETTKDGFTLYLSDSPNGGENYSVTIAIPRLKKK